MKKLHVGVFILAALCISTIGCGQVDVDSSGKQDLLLENNSACTSEDFEAKLKEAIGEYSINISMTIPGYALDNYYEIDNKYEEYNNPHYTDPDTVVLLLDILGIGIAYYHIKETLAINCTTGKLLRIGGFGPYMAKDLFFPPERWTETPVTVKDPNVLPHVYNSHWEQTEWEYPVAEGYYYYILVNN